MKPKVRSLIAAPVAVFVLAAALLATLVLVPSIGNAQDARVAKSMAALKDETAKLGAPKIEGNEPVGGWNAPALYFGKTKMSNNFAVVDAVAKEAGEGIVASLFVNGGGDLYIRVATTVMKPGGSGRAIGTVLREPALDAIKAGNPYYGEAPVLGEPYITGYEPIKDASGAIIGVYAVGYKK
jgi:hypothetical protein